MLLVSRGHFPCAPKLLSSRGELDERAKTEIMAKQRAFPRRLVLVRPDDRVEWDVAGHAVRARVKDQRAVLREAFFAQVKAHG